MPGSPFLFEGGQLALDLANTRPRVREASGDRIASPERLLAWMEEAALLTADEAVRLRGSPPEARLLLDEARRLRDDVLAVLGAVAHDQDVPAHIVVALNRVLGRRRLTRRLEPADGAYRLVERAEPADIVGLLAPIASAAGKLLSADRARLRQCSDSACAVWFLDTSRGGRRRWCSMARCGNRAKAATHYRRSKTSG